MKENFALKLSKWLYENSDDYLGSDGMVNGKPAFQHDIKIDGRKYTVYLTN